MDWVKKYQLFLFDFDGLLVNTEAVHFQAYCNMCKKRGFDLDWTFEEYTRIAHYSSHGLEESVYKQFPELKEQEPVWKVLYREKTEAFLALVREGRIGLMPGAAELLEHLDKAQVKRCVVTHSLAELVHTIREKNSVLNTIPNWITREDYTHPKPDSESYQVAINRFATPEDQIVGFEDTPRGLQALMGTRATPVLVCTTNYPEIPQFEKRGAIRFQTLKDIQL